MTNANVQNFAIMSAGMRILRENLGIIESEIFITNISRNEFDYTKWRENLWDGLTARELFERAAKGEEKYSVPENVQII